MALSRFADRLKRSSVSVGGILQCQETGSRAEDCGLYAIDVADGQRYPLSLPTRREDECRLDAAALAEISGIIRRAVDDRVALIVVEKFGEREQAGKGLHDEIFHAIAEGVPLLIAVPETALPRWQECTGGLGSIVDFDERAFDRWWRGIAVGGQ